MLYTSSAPTQPRSHAGIIIFLSSILLLIIIIWEVEKKEAIDVFFLSCLLFSMCRGLLAHSCYYCRGVVMGEKGLGIDHLHDDVNRS